MYFECVGFIIQLWEKCNRNFCFDIESACTNHVFVDASRKFQLIVERNVENIISSHINEHPPVREGRGGESIGKLAPRTTIQRTDKVFTCLLRQEGAGEFDARINVVFLGFRRSGQSPYILLHKAGRQETNDI